MPNLWEDTSKLIYLFFLNPDPAHKFCDADGQTKQKYCVSLKLY